MRLRLDIAYHGAAFEGWQSQPGGNTIQDHLENAFSKLCQPRIVVHGAGRTDSGVHAECQTAHADVPDGRLNLRGWANAINAHLPERIRVMGIQEAAPDFHARFSAKGKIYRYSIWNAPAVHPLECDRAWHVPQKLNLEAIQQTCTLFTGRHDFAAFSLRRTDEPEKTWRTISNIQVESCGLKICLTFEGEGFLYKMVRILAAAAVRHGTAKASLEELSASLHEAHPPFLQVAPAHGLCLVKVLY